MTTTTEAEFNPEPGSLVRYHGSLTQFHGLWRVRGVIEHGPYAGRLQLELPIDEGETLTISRGNKSISPA